MQGSEAGSSSERTRTSMTVEFCKKLKELMVELQNLRMRLHDEYRSAQTAALPFFVILHINVQGW